MTCSRLHNLKASIFSATEIILVKVYRNQTHSDRVKILKFFIALFSRDKNKLPMYEVLMLSMVQ